MERATIIDRQTDRQRNLYLDGLKAISIILVVIGHCIQYGCGSAFLATASFFEDLLFKAIYSFHMPLFMLISGYCFCWSIKKRGAVSLALSQVKSLLIPICCWSILYQFILKLTRIVLNGEGFSFAWFIGMFKYCLTNFWFLWSVVICSFIVIMVKRFLKDSIWVYILILIAFQFLPNYMNLQYHAYMYPYFVFGYITNKRNFTNLICKCNVCKKSLMLFVSIVAWGIMFSLFKTEHFIYNSGTSLLQNNLLNQLGINALRYIIGFIGSFAISLSFWMIWCIAEKHLKILSFVGKRTLGIYIVSTYINIYLIIPLTETFLHNYALVLIESIGVIAITLTVTVMLEKSRITRALFLGGR